MDKHNASIYFSRGPLPANRCLHCCLLPYSRQALLVKLYDTCTGNITEEENTAFAPSYAPPCVAD